MKTKCLGHEYLKTNNGHQNLCLDCYREYQRDYAKKLRKNLSEMINEYKLSVGCKHCGYNQHPAALEFDHIIPVKTEKKKRYGFRNKKEFSNLLQDPNVQVLCSNCHSIKTRENGDYKVREAI